MKSLIKNLIPHLWATLGFIVLGFLYAFPILQGKTLNQHDTMQARAGAQSLNQFHEKTGEWSAWCDSMFGGMPAYTIAGDYPYAFFSKVGGFITSSMPNPVIFFVLMMLGAYILLITLLKNSNLDKFSLLMTSAIGAVAYGFCTYSVVSIEAGHLSKMLAIAYAPMVMAGIWLCLRGEYLKGATLTGLFMTLEIYANHVQITYYSFFMIGLLFVYEGIMALKNKTLPAFLKATAVAILAVLLGVATNAERLWNNYDYVKESIRGKSELSSTLKKQPGGGLEKDYAFEYSYGIGESLTFLIPNALGGASATALDKKSAMYGAIAAQADEATAAQFVENAPTYWGDMSFTAGPAYVGALIAFLFILGLFIVRNPIKWWLLATTVLFMMFSWGKNFEVFNNLFFAYFPLFNKFRAVTMILSVMQLSVTVLAVLALHEILANRPAWASLKKPLLISVGIVAALCLLPAFVFSFSGTNDAQLRDYLAQAAQNKEFGVKVVNALVADRQGLYWADALRTLALILACVGLLWAFAKDKIKATVLLPVLLALTVFDFFTVGKRYFNNKDFVTKSAVQQSFEPTPADQQIMADKDPNFRVYNLSSSPLQDAQPSYFHKSIGGYSAVRLRRYQELLENQIFKGNQAVLNMLNVKYFLQQNQQSGQVEVAPNPQALGHAWFVKKYQIVPNADAEMKGLDKLNAKETALIDQRFENQVKSLSIAWDSTNTLKLTDYKPNHLTYQSNAKSEQLAVFSEVYYKGERDWNAYIDGTKVPHLRTDYLLRGMKVPAGSHKIEFKFEPYTVEKGKQIDLIANILLAGLLLGYVVMRVRGNKV